MKTFEGKVCKVRVLKKSKSSETGDVMKTFELEYPRFILAEVNTHRMTSKNSSSSRAIPFAKMLETIMASPAMPCYWGKNQPGMQAKEELSPFQIDSAKAVWLTALDSIASYSIVLDGMSLHKQTINRLLEPFQTMKTVMSGTEFENLYWLRDHPDAQPEFNDLAHMMRIADKETEYQILHPGQWHLPYVDLIDGKYFDSHGTELTLEQAKHISASCCAQVSYRKLDQSAEKAEKIFKQLIESEPCHASPVEHQATPMGAYNVPFMPETWENGITHVRRDGTLWSGNLQGWIQHRQLIPNNVRW